MHRRIDDRLGAHLEADEELRQADNRDYHNGVSGRIRVRERRVRGHFCTDGRAGVPGVHVRRHSAGYGARALALHRH